jgi:hypothetical protein
MSMITTHNHHDAAIWLCWFKLVVPLVYKWVKRSFEAWFAKCVIWMILIFLNVMRMCCKSYVKMKHDSCINLNYIGFLNLFSFQVWNHSSTKFPISFFLCDSKTI